MSHLKQDMLITFGLLWITKKTTIMHKDIFLETSVYMYFHIDFR